MSRIKPEQVVVITVDDVDYRFYPERITGLVAGKVRAATSRSVQSAVQALADDPDLDVLAVLCFAAALQTDPTASYETIAGSISYGSAIAINPDEGEVGEV